MANAPISFTVRCSNNSSTKEWKWFSSLFYHALPLFFLSRLSYKQLLKSTCQLYKVCYRKTYITAFGFKSLISKKIFAENNFLTSWERSDKKFFSFSTFFTSKFFPLQTTSSGSFSKVWWKSRNRTETRNSSEAYLEPSQRSMMEPFPLNS